MVRSVNKNGSIAVRSGSPAPPLLRATALRPAPGDLGGEGVKLVLPKAPKLIEPRVDRLERSRIDGVESAIPVRPNAGEARLAQHLEVLGDRRLGDPELAVHDLDDRARSPLAAREQLEDAAAHRIPEDVQRVHQWPAPRL